MLDQAQIYKLFGELDRLPGIMEPRIGRWRAWPMAKMQLVWHLMLAPSQGTPPTPMFWLRKLARRLPRYAAALPLLWRQAHLGIPSGGIGMLHVPRMHRCADGRERDFIFGELLTGAGLNHPVVPLRHPLLGEQSPPARGAIDLACYHLLSEQLALPFMATPRVRQAAADLNRRLDDTAIPLSRRARGRKVLLALALFEARRRLFRLLYRQLGLAALVVSYAPGRYAEIAAARELGLPVIELQHGAIGSHCPDYAWPSELKQYKDDMPLPDRIAVFGRMFRDLVLSSGFWTASEIVVAGAASMDSPRSDAARDVRRPSQLIFMGQGTSRTAATTFWRGLTSQVEFASSGFHVAFKPHPEEMGHVEPYRNLVRIAPDRFSLLGDDVNPIDAMLAADVVVSYNSMALIEALALGRGAISICGGSIPDGFAGSFGLPDIVRVMPHVDSPAALLRVLSERAGSEDRLAQWQDEALRAGKDYFCDGFTTNTTALINGVLARHDCSVTAGLRSRAPFEGLGVTH